MKRRILLTAALPYANGDIHLGHLVEYVQADIWARFQKLRGHECWFVCADDAHGTPVMLRAAAENTAPEDLVRRMQAAHERDFAGFLVAFDNYHSTHSEENRLLSESMYGELKARGCISEREIEQLYDARENMFLPDRYVRGECPKCGAAEQYGDACEICGGVHAPGDLKNPVSVLSGARPELRPSLHYFLQLRDEEESLKAWLSAPPPDNAGGGETPRLQREAVNKLGEWLGGGLRDWDISRDPPYFGFRIPDAAAEKYFYVWLDAPIGYMASFKNLCGKNGGGDALFDAFWRADADDMSGGNGTELYHFIGKDILYFHGLFWPTMLKNSGFRRPTRLFAHGFLTVNGEKMSKSRGTFITARRYLQSGINPEALRYYYACKLGNRIEDIDLHLDDFAARVNGDLVGKLVNIPSRAAGFINRLFGDCLDDAGIGDSIDEGALAAAYEQRRYHEVIRLIMRHADDINAQIDAAKPWLMAKDKAQHAALHAVCSRALRRFDLLIGYLSPVLPALARQTADFLRREAYAWESGAGIAPLPPRHQISRFTHLMQRLQLKTVNALVQPQGDEPAADKAAADGIATLDDFAKINLRVAVIKEAAAVDGADSLLRLTLDVGDGRPRQVFSGIKKYYAPEALTGRRVIYFANLKPRRMRFGESEGMILAAESGGGVVLLQPEGDAAAGAKVS